MRRKRVPSVKTAMKRQSAARKRLSSASARQERAIATWKGAVKTTAKARTAACNQRVRATNKKRSMTCKRRVSRAKKGCPPKKRRKGSGHKAMAMPGNRRATVARRPIQIQKYSGGHSGVRRRAMTGQMMGRPASRPLPMARNY